jgi:hypothetical protein
MGVGLSVHRTSEMPLPRSGADLAVRDNLVCILHNLV